MRNLNFSYRKILSIEGMNVVLVFVVVQIIAIIFSISFPEKFRYISYGNIQVLLKAIPQIGIMAMGVNLLMISGEFDLSIGSTFAFCSLILARTFNAGLNINLAIICALLAGGFIGYTNGLLLAKTKIPSFIITLGTMYIWRGAVLFVSGMENISFYSINLKVYNYIFGGSIGPIQMQFIWFLIVAVIAYYILEKTILGNHIFGVGGNKDAAAALGVNVDMVKIKAYVVLGFFIGLSAIVSTFRVQTVSPIQGQGLELDAIAACVIGGTALTGGKGSIVGAFFGAAVLYSIQDILFLVRAPGEYIKLFVGIIIIVAVFINSRVRKTIN